MSTQLDPPVSFEYDQYHRASARHGLDFHVDQYGYYVEHAGWKSETRPATDAEKMLWRHLVPELPIWDMWSDAGVPEVQALNAVPEEFQSCVWGPEPHTLSAQDVAVLLRLQAFTPCNTRTDLQRGLCGWYTNPEDREPTPTPIYVSRLVPKGYYYHGSLETWRPPTGERVLAPELTPDQKNTVRHRFSSLTCQP